MDKTRHELAMDKFDFTKPIMPSTLFHRYIIAIISGTGQISFGYALHQQFNESASPDSQTVFATIHNDLRHMRNDITQLRYQQQTNSILLHSARLAAAAYLAPLRKA
jgi:hypothetical protein